MLFTLSPQRKRRLAVATGCGGEIGTDYCGDPTEEAIVVDGSPARAYPVRILSYHEIVNDIVSDVERSDRPIAVTWCPICASGVVYDRRVGGRTLTFGTSGKLTDDALVLYDRETGSEWKQPLGSAIAGRVEGHELTVVPASFASVEAFRSEHPDGLVLQPVHGGDDPAAAYDMAGYDRYDGAAGFGLREMRGEGPERTWDRADIDAKTTVLGLVRDDGAVGFPVPVVRDAGGVVTATVGGQRVVVLVDDGVHAFADPGFELAFESGTLRGDGTAWDPATGRSEDGRRLDRVPARRLYAFAWQDDHGPDSFYGLG
jgi:hypothetical protein